MRSKLHVQPMRRRTFLFGLLGLATYSRFAPALRQGRAARAAALPLPVYHDPRVTIRPVSTGRVIHRFFDTSPISPSGRYVALFRFPSETVSPKPGDAGDVLLVDLKTGTERVVARSRGFEMQLGANVQWGATDHELYFNDVDPSDWSAYAIQLDPFSGRSRRLASTVFMVSADGRRLLTYDLARSRHAQVGYGLVLPNERAPRNIGPVDSDGVDVTDIASNRCIRITTIKDIYEKSVPSVAVTNPMDFEYYLFQVKWNPQGTRVLTTMQWTPRGGGERKRCVVTMNADGSDLRTAVTPAQWAKGGHHVNWAPDGEYLSMNLDIDGTPGLEVIRVRYDGSGMNKIFSPGSGHPSYNPVVPDIMMTDAYPNEPLTGRDGIVPLRFLNLKTQEEVAAARVFVSKTEGEFRIDPHPAWDRTGRYVVFNGFEGSTRNVFLADLKGLLPERR